MRNDPPTYRCDSDGCKSYCQLSPDEPDHEAALRDRGWRVESYVHFCPGCAARMAAKIPAPNGE